MARWEGDEVRIEIPRVVEADVRIVAGEVAVTAVAGTARLDAEVLSGDELKVELENGVLTVVHEPKSWLAGIGSKRTESFVTLRVPATVPVTVRTVSADAVVAGLQSGADVTTVSGTTTATDLAGEVNLRTVSGDIELQQVRGDVVVNSVSGAVTVAGRVPSLNGRSVSGDLTFDLDEAPEASLSTVSGEVLMRLPANASFRVDATTMSGHLDSAFQVHGTTSRRRLSGTAGDAATAPAIDVRTMSGDVAILRRELASTGAGDSTTAAQELE